MENAAARLSAMMLVQAHRGPDQEGMYFSDDGRLALGNSRLAIVAPEEKLDLPLQSAIDGSVISFNGEIYDHQAQRAVLKDAGVSFRTGTDTEVLLEGLRLKGLEFLNGIDGMWAFALYNPQQKSLTLGRDLLGERQMFYAKDGDELVFASEGHTVLAGMRNRPTLDASQALTAMRYHVAAPGQTLISELQRVRAGHILTVDAGGEIQHRRIQRLHPEKWFDFFGADPSETAVLEKLSELLSEAVGNRLPKSVPFLSTLSGGIDSTLVASFAAEQLAGLQTLYGETHDAPLEFEGELNEYKTSVKTSEIIGSTHVRVSIDATDSAGMLKKAAAK